MTAKSTRSLVGFFVCMVWLSVLLAGCGTSPSQGSQQQADTPSSSVGETVANVAASANKTVEPTAEGETPPASTPDASNGVVSDVSTKGIIPNGIIPNAVAFWHGRSFNIPRVGNVTIPSGELDIFANGSGLKLKSVKALWVTLSKGIVCDSWIDFDFYDGNSKGAKYFHDQGSAQTCALTHQRTWQTPANFQFKRGDACASLFMRRQASTTIDLISRVCMNVH